MKYKLNTINYHTFEIYEVNKLAPRSYFIPFSSKTKADAVSLKDRRYASDKVRCLNGDWDFKFYPVPSDVPETLDTDAIDFDKLDVPSCWQFRGYDKPMYLNIRYPFPFRQPQIPQTEAVGKVFSWIGSDKGVMPRWEYQPNNYNFVGVYRTFFDVADATKNRILSFMGVASCADVYLNGAFVGYSEGAHNMAEFDISAQVTEGQNELVVVVHRWCNGTYLECQDMFRNNGIFRDVLLFENEKTDFFDIDFKTEKLSKPDQNPTTYKAIVSAELTGDSSVKVTLEGNGLNVSQTINSTGKKITAVFDSLDVTEWNAEDPTLYNLYLELPGSCVKTRVGFKKVAIEGRLYKFNDRLIKFKGVNHHDTSAEHGYCMTLDDIERDVKICKEYNIDTIRTSHYPPDPYLIELCDELGVYVCDETDIETHGAFAMNIPPSYNYISNDPKWKSHYVDRVSRMYQRDKLHASIILWSLGNEAGGYACTDAEYDYLKAHTDIPVHYESAIHCKRVAYDVGSMMYPAPAIVHAVGEGKAKQPQLNDRPFFLCEYEHAMGVGPGNIESYWKEFYNYDALMGGCIWEMVDHAVLEEDGGYTYGGDHEEFMHDSNFCVDGLFYPDRTPSTGAFIAKHAYRPLRVRHIKDDEYEIFNTTAFSQSTRYRLDCTWTDGEKSLGIATVNPNVGPLSKATCRIVPEVGAEAIKSATGSLYLNIKTIDTRDERLVDESQITLASVVATEKAASPATTEENLFAQLKLESGKPSLACGNAALSGATPYTIVYRAHTDNDVTLTGTDVMKGYYGMAESVKSVNETAEKKVVISEVKAKHSRYQVTDTYEPTTDGILVTSTIKRVSGRDELPRFGKTYVLPASYNSVTYTGRLGESYVDMKDQYPIGTETKKVEEMVENYIRPQESGNRCDTTRAALTDGTHTVEFTALDAPFELSIKPYSDVELLAMKHRSDVQTTGTYVTINAFQMGIGTGSCGPVTAPEFRYDCSKEYTVKFKITVR